MVIGKYVTLDPRDNSIELSNALIRFMRTKNYNDLRVVTFKVSDSDDYGFIVSPDNMGIDESVQYPTIQYNSKTKKYGYDCFNPSVNAMLYNWGLYEDIPVRCNVKTVTANNKIIYIIKKPR